MISDQYKVHVRSIVQSPQWQTIEYVAEQLQAHVQQQSVIRDSEWETIKTMLIREGQIQGIKLLTQELERIAHDKA